MNYLTHTVSHQHQLTRSQSCAATLMNHPNKFKVTVLEACDVVGGQATSIPLDEERYGAAWMNNGVQGGSPVSYDVLMRYRRY